MRYLVRKCDVAEDGVIKYSGDDVAEFLHLPDAYDYILMMYPGYCVIDQNKGYILATKRKGAQGIIEVK